VGILAGDAGSRDGCGLVAVITTIQPPTACTVTLLRRLAEVGGRLIVAGDVKGPADYPAPAGIPTGAVQLLDIGWQLRGPYRLGTLMPTQHYCRKNIGYLEAIARGATCIYETDDDNRPLPGWARRSEHLSVGRFVGRAAGGGASRWVNVYKYFTDAHIWPRGLPLDEIIRPVPCVAALAVPRRAPVQQGLVNHSPDVDAIWRLVLDRPFDFEVAPSVYLEPGNWCPFNTQSTWWWPAAYPVMYVPALCSFRMCDIWRSLVAQRCLWELDAGVAFHAPEAHQDRNVHDPVEDFRDEIPGYLQNKNIVRALEGCRLSSGEHEVGANLLTCYEALVGAGVLPTEELSLLACWLSDLDAARLSASAAGCDVPAHAPSTRTGDDA
jgi:hypothetical protein